MTALTEQGYGPSDPDDDAPVPEDPHAIYLRRYESYATTAEREGAKMVAVMEAFERRRCHYPASSYEEFLECYPLDHPVSPYD